MMNPRFLKKAISIVMAIALLMMSCMPVMAEDIHTVNDEPQKQEAVVASNVSNAGKADEAKEEKEEVKAQSTVAATATATPDPNVTATATPTPTPTATLDPDAATTATATPDPNAAATATATPDPDAAATATPTPTPTPEPTATPTPTPTPAPTAKPFANCTIIMPSDVTYNGKSQMPGVSIPGVKVKDSDTDTYLDEKDYTVKFYRIEGGKSILLENEDDFINAGEITVMITSANTGKYTNDVVLRTYTINQKNLNDVEISLKQTEITFDGEDHEFDLVPTVSELKDGEYSVAYQRDGEITKDFTNAGTIDVVVTVTNNPNYTGSRKLSCKITKKSDAKVEVALVEESVTYNGATQKPVIDKVTLDGKTLGSDDYTVNYKRGEVTITEDKDFEDVGTITVVVTPKANDNYDDIEKVNATATFTINPKELTKENAAVVLKEDSVTYNGAAQKPSIDNVTLDGNPLNPGDYTVTYKRGEDEIKEDKDFVDAGTITVVITGQGNFTGSIDATYMINKLNVTLTVDSQEKNYGEKTPEFTVKFDAADAEGNSVTVTDEVVGKIRDLLTMKVAGTPLDRVNDVVEQTVKFVENADQKLSEEPGKYPIKVELGKNNNIELDKEKSTLEAEYKINNKIRLTVPEKIDSHTAKLTGFGVKAMDGSNIADKVTLTASVDTTNANTKFIVEPKDWSYNLTGEEVQLRVTKYKDGDNGKEWQTYLPAGAEITYTAVTDGGNPLTLVIAKEGETAEVEELAEVTKTVDKEPVAISISVSEDGKLYNEKDTNKYILAQEASLIINAFHGDEITTADYFEIECNGVPLEPRPADGEGKITITPKEFEEALGENSADYVNTNPTQFALIKIMMIDKDNHKVDDKEIELCVDTGAVDGGATSVGNREDNAVCDLLDSVGSITEITGNYGSVAMAVAKGNTEGQKLTIGLAGWRDTPDQLPRSGDVITIKYKDKVGHEVTHMLNIVKSPAKISNTIRVKADEVLNNEGVVGKTLTFTGSTTKCEKLILRIGGKTITIDPQKMENPYNSGEYAWMKKVNLDELGIPAGVPQTVTISYDDLAGGEDSTRITYKDHAMTPALSCDLVNGTKRFWGFLEENVQNLYITINRANVDTPSRLSEDNAILLNRTKGYFYVELGNSYAALAAGDEVVFYVTDLCGNQITYSKVVGAETSEHKAMLLGANIMDEISVNINGEIKDEYMHAFATPIDVEKLAGYENQSMTLPILAYDAIEIGTMTISLNGTQIDVEYNISEERFNSMYIPEDAKVYWSTYTEKPTVDELLNGNHRTAKLEMNGALKPIDASVNVDENGEPKGVVWLYAAVDVKFDAKVFYNFNKYNIKPYIWVDSKEIVEKYADKVGLADKQDDYFALYNDFYNEANRAA